MPPPEQLGPDEELVAGRRPVEEAFVARRPAIRLLVVPQRRAALEQLVLHATNLRIPIVEVEGGSLTALAGFDGHQGIALVVEPRRYASPEDILARAKERDEPPLILVLDSLEDPHNVGSLLRSAEAAGVHGVLFPTHRQAPLSPSAVKASAGAIEHLLLAAVDDLPSALSDLHARGIRILGSDGDAPLTARQTDLRGPIAIVVGSEGRGLGPAVRRRADAFMRIPMKGAVASLNAAVAGSVLLFEALAQRDGDLPAPTPATDEPAVDTPRSETDAPAAAEEPVKRARAPRKATTTDAKTATTKTKIEPTEAKTVARTSKIAAPKRKRSVSEATAAAGDPPQDAAAEDLLPVDATMKPATRRAPRAKPAKPRKAKATDTPHA